MGTSVPRALTASILVLGVFLTPFAHVVHGEEEVASSTTPAENESDTASSTTPAEPTAFEVTSDQSTTTPDPLPTGILFDNSYADTEWNVNGYGGGHIIYTFPDPGTWTTPNTVVYARVQKPIDTPCSIFYVAGVTGMIVFSRTTLLPSFYNDHSVESADHKFCDFYFGAGGIPPQTPIEGFILSGANLTVPGSSKNAGTSLNGSGQDPVPGGFAFQLCGTDGCSGGFASSTPPAPPEPKISNVLFLPGIKGSRLYEDSNTCGEAPGPCTFKLWEPYGDGVARDLLLDAEGKSKESVYVKEDDILDEVAGQKFYASFLNNLRQKDASDEYGSAWKWKAVPYDWRLSLTDIVDNGAQHGDKIYYDEATTSPYIIQTLRELAASSPTGKVTIIAHSNGGLVTKALLRKIGDEETAALVDKIIFVGVPQSGAPQALGALLFGYGESLPGKTILPEIFMSKSLARELAENSPMAYHLIPSYRYLADTQDPFHSIISFTGSHLYQKEQEAYGTSIDTIEERDGFLKALEGGREKPEYTDLTVANVLNTGLITYANQTHDAIDNWTPPASVQLYQIAGWGADTVSGISFYDEQKVLGATIGYKRQYRAIFVEDGDGVVPVPSALMLRPQTNAKNYWLNLVKIKRDHGNIFESDSLNKLISNELTGSEQLPEFISDSAPNSESTDKKLIFQLHSPLTLGLFDQEGKYTGLNKDGSVSEEVPNVSYGEFGDVKYLIAPAGTTYRLVLGGQSDGRFSLDIQEQNGTTTTTSTIADVPTTAKTIASLTITNGVADASPLSVDTNGDGTEDSVVKIESGETLQVTQPDTASETVTETRGSSVNNIEETSYNPEVAVLPSAAPINLPRLLVSIPRTPSVQPENPIEANNQPGINNAAQTQTASAYDAFAPLAEWFKSLLYNIWKMLKALFT